MIEASCTGLAPPRNATPTPLILRANEHPKKARAGQSTAKPASAEVFTSGRVRGKAIAGQRGGKGGSKWGMYGLDLDGDGLRFGGGGS